MAYPHNVQARAPAVPAGAEIGSHAALLTKEDPDQAIRVSRAASSGSGQIPRKPRLNNYAAKITCTCTSDDESNFRS